MDENAQAFSTVNGAESAIANMRDIGVSESHQLTNRLLGVGVPELTIENRHILRCYWLLCENLIPDRTSLQIDLRLPSENAQSHRNKMHKNTDLSSLSRDMPPKNPYSSILISEIKKAN